MDYQKMSINERVNIMRKIALSFVDEDEDIEVCIPENDDGVKPGYYTMKNLLYFLADMYEE